MAQLYAIFPTSSGSSSGGGGGGSTTASDTAGTYVTPSLATSHTITPSQFSTAPTAANKMLFVVAATGPAEATSVTYTHPGSLIREAPGSGYNPRVRVVLADYAASWAFSASVPIRVAGVALTNAVGVAASSPVYMFTPNDPGPIAHDANAVGLAITVINFTGAAVTVASAGHTTIVNSPLDARQIHIAKTTLSAVGTYNPAAATAGPGSEESTTISVVVQPTAVTSGGSVPPPTIPTFTAAGAVQITPSTNNVSALVAGSPDGTFFELTAGTFSNISDVRPRNNQHFKGQGPGLTILEGTGKNYAFRAGNLGSSDGVVIGNMKLQNYGNGTSRAEYGAVQAQPTDTVGGQFTYGVANNWFLYDLELSKNSSNGIRISDNCTVYRCTAYGHTVTGIGGDRNRGGLIHSCTLEANGLNPATGANQNGANAKFTWINSAEGYTEVVPLAAQRPKAQMVIANCTFNATRSGIVGTCDIGLWWDLDVQNTRVYDSTFNGHTTTSIFWEGSNDGLAQGNTINNSDGFGPAYDGNFSNAGICCGESTNITFRNNTVIDCTYAMMNRMSNRTSDWVNNLNSSFVNFAWPPGSGGVRYWITLGTPSPVPGVTDRSNVWTGNNVYEGNTLINCGRVVVNEGTDTAGQTVHGTTDLNSIDFINNDYSGSPGIQFYHLSNTGISLAQWQALPYTRDQ